MALVEQLLPAKKIFVYSVATASSGGLSILKDFYNEAAQCQNVEFVFVVSTPIFENKENITVIRLPWVKKSWFHRLYCDWILAPKLVQEYGCDRIFSLQNTSVPRTNIPQTIYLHQPLPFSDYKFSFFENRLFWIYQNVISKIICCGLKIASKVIVQTRWIKDACVKKCNLDANKVVIVQPTLDDVRFYDYRAREHNERSFFYPATPIAYKNHRVILSACKLLKEKGIKDYKVIFSFTGDENPLAAELKKFVAENELPVEFLGVAPRDKVMQLYAQCLLLFPSKIESFGMPLLEARKSNAPIIAGATPFAREILDGYEDAKFFPVDDAEALAKLMGMSC